MVEGKRSLIVTLAVDSKFVSSPTFTTSLQLQLTYAAAATATRGRGLVMGDVTPVADNTDSIDVAALWVRHSFKKSVNIYQYSAQGHSNSQGKAHLDSIKRPTSALGMKLDTPYFSPRSRCRLDPFHGRIITVDKEWFPSLRERVLQLQRVLVILAKVDVNARTHIMQRMLPSNIDSACFNTTR